MATYDLVRARAVTNPTYSLLRAQAVGQLAAGKQYDLVRVRAQGAVVAGTSYDLLRVRAQGVLAFLIEAMPALSIQEPGRLITQTAKAIGLTPTSWTWTQTSGPTVSLTQVGASVSFRAPATRDGTTVVLSVTGTSGSLTTEARTFTVPVRPAVFSVNGRASIAKTDGVTLPPVVGPKKLVLPVTGQSNGRGAATDFVATDQYNSSQVKMWDFASSTFVPAVEPLKSPDTGSGMGIVNTFVKRLLATLDVADTIYIVNTARGGTGFRPPSTGEGTGMHWDHRLADDADNLALRSRDAVLAALGEIGPDAQIAAILANHGSNDGVNYSGIPNFTQAQYKALYKADLTEFITWYRSQIGAPLAPYLMMQMRPSLLGESRHSNIEAMQLEVAAEVAKVYRGSSPNGTQYNKADSVHFNALGVRAIGEDLANGFVTLGGVPA